MKDTKRLQKVPNDSERFQTLSKDSKISKMFQKILKEFIEGKYSCKALNSLSRIAKNFNVSPTPLPDLPEFKKLEVPCFTWAPKKG